MTARKQAKLTRSTSELAQAAPQVIAQRLQRMASATWPIPAARDMKEFQRMGAEKVLAFSQAWQAMALQSLVEQQQWAAWWMQSCWRIAQSGFNPLALWQLPTGAGQQLWDAWLDIATQGMAPIHDRAVANARRLRKG